MGGGRWERRGGLGWRVGGDVGMWGQVPLAGPAHKVVCGRRGVGLRGPSPLPRTPAAASTPPARWAPSRRWGARGFTSSLSKPQPVLTVVCAHLPAGSSCLPAHPSQAAPHTPCPLPRSPVPCPAVPHTATTVGSSLAPTHPPPPHHPPKPRTVVAAAEDLLPPGEGGPKVISLRLLQLPHRAFGPDQVIPVALAVVLGQHGAGAPLPHLQGAAAPPRSGTSCWPASGQRCNRIPHA